MKAWLHKIEVIADKLIPYMLVLLLIIIVLELGFPQIAEDYYLYIQIADSLVIGIFLTDLIFKYIRVRNIPTFLKRYWLDVVAVFPFFLLFRSLEPIIELFSKTFSEEIATIQKILHTSVEVEKEGGKLAAVEAVVKELKEASRTEKFVRFIRPLFRAPRFAKAIAFFEKPTGKHHKHGKKAKR